MSLASTTELSIIMPCLNEAETLEVCIVKANRFLTESGIVGEVIIADNGSTDGSQDIARRNGARVIDVPVKGYGTALMAGIDSAHGRYVVIGDSDDSYDFSALMLFIEKLRAGYQLVMGNRFVGGIAEGAMPCLEGMHIGADDCCWPSHLPARSRRAGLCHLAMGTNRFWTSRL